MNILVIGSGGREHALAWKLAEPDAVTRVFVAPGNAGTAQEPKLENVALDPMDIEGLAQFAKAQGCALTVVGPEAPLVAGIVDRFSEHGLACLGPTAGAAQLEGSKSFTKDFLARHAIPTASYAVFTDLGPALDYIHQQDELTIFQTSVFFTIVFSAVAILRKTYIRLYFNKRAKRKGI